MAKSKRKQKAESRDRKESKKFFTVVIIATVVLLALLYMVFAGMAS